MRKHIITIVSLFMLLVMAFASSRAVSAENLTYKDLVKRYTDLEHLAVLPDAGEKGAMWSSWDRASTYDEASGKYVNWFANADGTGFIRKEDTKIVMAEMDGPGCIWRIWSAGPGGGHVKIYLDGAPEPTVDMPFGDYFSGNNAPFNYKSLSYYTWASGGDLYMPIPYQKSCKIVADEKWGEYYHITYSSFPKDTTVPTFKKDMAPEDVAALKELDDFFANKLGENPGGIRKGEKTVEKTAKVKPGQSVKIAELKGARAITAIKCKMDFKDRGSQMAPLRELAMRITWDGQKEPAVWCPLGDFFGTAPGRNYFKALPLGMTTNGFYSYWYMPFAKSAVVELVNDGKVEQTAKFSITHAPLTRSFDGLGHFHAKWHRDIFQLPEDRKIDWTILKTTGRGRFLGMMLHVLNKGGWWGEGDEKFYVDNEKYPSTFGTGSEDYFGYAWCNPTWFVKALHGQTMTEQNAGHQSIYRWQIPDNVPFHTAFEGYIEKYCGNDFPTLYACVTAWYLSPDGVDPIGTSTAADRTEYVKWPPRDVAGFTVLGSTAGGAICQILGEDKPGTWKDNNHLVWLGAKPGDKLNLLLPAPEDGEYKLEVAFTKAPWYGIFQIYVDNKKVGEPIDLCVEGNQVPSGPIDFGKHKLTKGDHTFTIEMVGSNEKKEKAYFFGIDQVILTPVK
jgi:hypothetical protein